MNRAKSVKFEQKLGIPCQTPMSPDNKYRDKLGIDEIAMDFASPDNSFDTINTNIESPRNYELKKENI